jgi:hypothetical protein
MLKRK